MVDDGNAQTEVSLSVVDAVREFLGGPHQDSNGSSFEFGEHLESNWGAVYGGALAAAAVTSARCATPDRSPRSLHVQFVRSVPCGASRVTVDVRHLGRAVATVQVDLYDARDKLAVTALATMVTPDAVATDLHDTSARMFSVSSIPLPSATRELRGTAPITAALGMGGSDARSIDNIPPSITGHPSPLGRMVVPWTEQLTASGPEVACLIADVMNGMPIVRAFLGSGVTYPNTDLSLRFTTAPAQREVHAAGTLVSIQRGTTTVAIEVHAGDQQLAHGLSTTLLIPAPPNT
jgi:acyl-coenzyme A thioesterase PaaI-like protein